VPGFHHDLFSAFYPLGAASPAIDRLHLEDHGLRWRRAPLTLANPPDGRCAFIAPERDRTAARLEEYAEGDGAGWEELMSAWDFVSREMPAR
jgi:phytoene dehydrogenase-like protein